MADHERHIVYMSYDGLTDPLGQSQILPYVKGLAKAGYRFTIISFEKEEAFLKNRAETEKLCLEDSIQWRFLKYHKKPPVVSTLYDVFVLWNKIIEVYSDGGIDIIHCRSYITALVGLRAKQKLGVKLVFDMRGFWADERVEGRLWNLKNPVFKNIYNFFKRKERQFITKADYVVSLTHNAKQEIESWGVRNAPIAVIPTCVDLDLFDPKGIRKEEQQQLRIHLGISETDFVLLYLGSWGTWYMTSEMVRFFRALKTARSDAKFLIVSPDVVTVPEEITTSTIICTTERRKVPLYISLANLSILFIKTSYSKKASSATKVGEIMAMQVPILTNRGWGDIDRVLSDTGLFVDDYSTDKLISLITGIEKPQRYHVDDLSLSYGVACYKAVYDSLTCDSQ